MIKKVVEKSLETKRVTEELRQLWIDYIREKRTIPLYGAYLPISGCQYCKWEKIVWGELFDEPKLIDLNGNEKWMGNNLTYEVLQSLYKVLFVRNYHIYINIPGEIFENDQTDFTGTSKDTALQKLYEWAIYDFPTEMVEGCEFQFADIPIIYTFKKNVFDQCFRNEEIGVDELLDELRIN